MDEYALTTGVLSLAVLLYVWLREMGRLRRDNFRSDIRRLRDGLFDFMWQNGYEFNTPAYVEIRQALNGMLRLSRCLSPVKLLATMVHLPRFERPEPPLDRALRQTENEHLRDEVRRIQDAAVARMLKFFFLEGLRGALVKSFCRTVRVVIQLNRLRDRVLRAGRDLLIESYELGASSLSAEKRALLHR